jgi:N-methylhydantoinase B
LNYRVRLLRGEAKASFVMDHGVVGPPGLLGGEPGGTLAIEVSQSGQHSLPPHVSKGEGYPLQPGDWVQVRTPGGGGYGDARERLPAAVAQDVSRGYLSAEQAERQYRLRPAAE